METLRASQGLKHSFDSLKHTMSSGGGRELLYSSPIKEAAAVIDALEQVSTPQLGL